MKINLVVIRWNFQQGKEFFNESMTFRLNLFRLNLFRLKDISSNRHFVEYDNSYIFRRKVSKFV